MGILQRPLPDDTLKIVARGVDKEDHTRRRVDAEKAIERALAPKKRRLKRD